MKDMTKPKNPGVQQRKPGRPPIGNRAMTDQQRMARSRERLQRDGGHHLACRIQGYRWQPFAAEAQRQGKDPSFLARHLLGTVIDRFNAVTSRMREMLDAGATSEEVAEFYNNTLVRPLTHPL